MRPQFIIASFLLLLIFSSCEKQQSGPPGETATTGSFQLVADEVLKPVIDSLVQGFMIENPNAKVTVKYVSAAEAVRELMNHDARAILIDRSLSPTERSILQKDSVTLPEFQLAKDGIGCVVSAKSPLTVITMDDLRENFNSDSLKPNWSSVGRSSEEQGKLNGSLVDLDFALPAYPSSTEYSLDFTLLGADKQINAIRVRRFATTDSIIDYVKQDKKAMGFISSSWKHKLDISNDTTVKVLPVIPHDLSSQGISEPLLLHIGYIAEGVYPLVTRVNGYSFDVPNTIPRGFLAYAATAHGQTVFKNFGILPMTQPIRLVESK